MRPGVARLMTRAIALLALAVALAVARRLPGPVRPRPRAARSPAQAVGHAKRHQPARPAAGPVPAARRAGAFGTRAARSFATRWVNWDWRSAASQQRALARLATGGLARQLRANASSARVDATPRARQARSTRQRRRDRPQGRHAERARASSSRASRPTPTDTPTSAAGATASTSSASARDHDGWGVSAWEPQP